MGLGMAQHVCRLGFGEEGCGTDFELMVQPLRDGVLAMMEAAAVRCRPSHCSLPNLCASVPMWSRGRLAPAALCGTRSSPGRGGRRERAMMAVEIAEQDLPKPHA